MDIETRSRARYVVRKLESGGLRETEPVDLTCTCLCGSILSYGRMDRRRGCFWRDNPGGLSAQRAAPVGQTSARWQVLGVVAGGPASVAQVARAMGLARQSVQRTADLLAADGLVRYADNPHHRRAKLMTMTPKGQQAHDYIGRRQARWANRIGGQHDLEQMRTAAVVLRRLRESLVQDEQGSDSSASSDV